MICGGVTAQSDSINITWIPVDTIEVPSDANWHIDVFGNHYFNEADVLFKYDSSGTEKFHQSIKSTGKDFDLLNINSMKLLLFSREQQNVCFFDNTITRTEDCIELIDLNIENAQFVAPSNRPNLIWIYDNVNSKLMLANTEDSKVNLELTNIKGSFNFNELKGMQESDSYLYLFTDRKVVVLDRFGSLVVPLDASMYDKGIVYNNNVCLLSGNYLTLLNENATHAIVIKLPEMDIIDFAFQDKYLFLRTEKTVHKFRFEI